MGIRNRIARGWAVALSCVLALVLTVGLSGCAKGDEEEIRSIITESMDMLKNPSEETLADYIENSKIDISTLDAYGIDFYEFLGNCFKRLDYTVDGIIIDGDEATADLSLTNVDLNAAAGAAATEITDNIGDYTEMLSGENAAQDLMRTFMQLFYDNVDASTETVTTQASLTFKKKDGLWEVDKDSVVALVEAMYNSVEI